MKAPLCTSLPLFLLLPFAACTADSAGQGGYSFERSYGSVVTGPLDGVWGVTQDTLAKLASDVRVDQTKRIAEGSWQGAEVAVRVESKSPQETILRVSAHRDGLEDREIAERLQIAIQQALMR